MQMKDQNKPHIKHPFNGSRVRVPITIDRGEMGAIFDDAAWELLWPTPGADPDAETLQGAADLRTPSGTRFSIHPHRAASYRWEDIPPSFKGWLKQCKAVAGDTLIIEAVDIHAHRYDVFHEPYLTRDGPAIRRQTENFENLAFNFACLNRNRDPEPDSQTLAKFLLLFGYYRDSVAPEPISNIWNRVKLEPRHDADAKRSKVESKKPRAVYQLKIQVSESHPPIWRRLLIHDTATLDHLHQVIQQCMGWNGYEPHLFTINDHFYGTPEWRPDKYLKEEVRNDYQVDLGQIAWKSSGHFLYECGFKYTWSLEIQIEKRDLVVPDAFYPTCIDGERSSPSPCCRNLEDYAEYLKRLEDPQHFRGQKLPTWLTGYFDPDHFNLTLINKKILYRIRLGEG